MPLPRYNLYWSTDFRVDAISNRISRNRFTEILRYSHFNDNNKQWLTVETDLTIGGSKFDHYWICFLHGANQ
ncbi:hypothetical protein T10_851 [Trichinella papuae]|uniref:PiggyBac transposable element-derived protein domain-containing protein n=1 Tax=Trichinella papuae TaxID=268474 RepID=A0A0V1N1M3_9BILA|nr:hypothetical protein T10_851 [Trichinella papuae]